MNGKTLTAKILEYLYENPGASIKDLSTEFSASIPAIRNTLYRLKNNGYVERVGNGYILTSKGEWFVTKIIRGEKQEAIETDNALEEAVEKPKETQVSDMIKSGEETYDRNIEEKIKELEARILTLTKMFEKVMEELESLKRELKTEKRINKSEPKSEKKLDKLPRPVMNVKEAINILGSRLDELKLEGRVEVIGSIVVDTSFYEEFKKKFPIPVNEVDKLSSMEKILLNEMIRDARVIVHAGKYYKLIS